LNPNNVFGGEEESEYESGEEEVDEDDFERQNSLEV
jgi:hypothetical protein